MKSAIHLPLKDEQEIIEKAKDWALMHGIALRLKNYYDDASVSVAPFTLLPSVMRKKEFEEVVATQRVLSELMHKVAHDHPFLENSLKKTIQFDDFTKRLFDIYTTVRTEGFAQELSLAILRNDVLMSPSGPKQVEINSIASGFAWLGPVTRKLHRSDYLSDESSKKMKQVEFNTIASSFAGLSTQVTKLHRYILRELGRDVLTESLPENSALEGVCAGIVHAWEIYNKKRSVVVFLVEETTYNICDQRFMEFEIRRQQPEIRVLRRKFSDFSTAKLGAKKQLLLKDDVEVAVIYMRTGYDPNLYQGDKDWEIRLMIERSTAIKCPSIQYQLAGTKKIQQVLATPGAVEMFISNPEDVKRIRSLFTNIYSLDGPEGDSACNLAMKNPENYVLKPQREGGGNNIYRNDIPNLLSSMTNEERQAMILMQLIKPIPTQNIIVQRGSKNEICDIISELGVFSYVIGSASEIIAIKPAGHMLRSKPATVNEGGVASGYGALDSPFLI